VITLVNFANGQTPMPTAGTYTGGYYYVNANTTITSTLVLNSCQVEVEPGIIISVAYGASMTLDQGTDFYARYSTLWAGIFVSPNATLNVLNGSMIKDAEYGIYIFYNSNPATPPIVNASESYFWSNYISIYVSPSTPAINYISLSVTGCFFDGSLALLPPTNFTTIYDHTFEAIELNDVANCNIGQITTHTNYIYDVYNGIVSHRSRLFVNNTVIRNMLFYLPFTQYHLSLSR
jgi:hypothetical protein